MKYKNVNQQYDSDCVIAALATWTGASYAMVFSEAKRLGVHPRDGAGLDSNDTHLLGKSFGKHLRTTHYWGGLSGLLYVPSLNFERAAHCVFVEKYKIYDPQEDRPGLKWYKNGKKLKFPPNFGVAVDLNDPYSRDLYETHLARGCEYLKQWEKKGDDS